MGRFHGGRHRWAERNVAPDRRRHRWPVVSRNGIVIGSVELHAGRFVAVDLGGEAFGNYATLYDAREALLMAGATK
jgi:hypothetical protein